MWDFRLQPTLQHMVQVLSRIGYSQYPQWWSCTLLPPIQNTEHQQLWVADAVVAAHCVKSSIGLSLSATPLPCSVTLFHSVHLSSSLFFFCSPLSASLHHCLRHTYMHTTMKIRESGRAGNVFFFFFRQTGDKVHLLSLVCYAAMPCK